MGTEIDIFISFSCHKVLLFLFLNYLKTKTTFLAGGPHQNRQWWIWAPGRLLLFPLMMDSWPQGLAIEGVGAWPISSFGCARSVAFPYSAEENWNSFWEKSFWLSDHAWSRTFFPDWAVLVFDMFVCESRILGSLGFSHTFLILWSLSLRMFHQPRLLSHLFLTARRKVSLSSDFFCCPSF